MSPRFCTFRQDIFIWYVGHAVGSAFYFCCHSQLNQYNLLYHQAINAEYLGHAQHCWKVFALYWKSTRESARNAQDSGNWLDFILIHTWKMALDRGHIFFNILHYLIPFIQESHWPPSHTSTFCTSFTSETINKTIVSKFVQISPLYLLWRWYFHVSVERQCLTFLGCLWIKCDDHACVLWSEYTRPCADQLDQFC